MMVIDARKEKKGLGVDGDEGVGEAWGCFYGSWCDGR